MPSVTRAISLNLGVFLADNNIRRSVASFALNYQTQDASATTTYVTVQPGGTYTFTPAVTPTSLVVAQTTLPLVADVSYASLTTPPVPADTVKTIVNRLFVSDAAITGIVFENPNLEPVRLSLIQG